MDCIENSIGVRALYEAGKTEASKTGLYIEDLEGITLDRIAAIEMGKTHTAAELVPQLLRRAAMLLMEDVRVKLMPFIRDEFALEHASFGEFQDPPELLGSLVGTNGLRVNIHGGQFSKLYISKVYICVEAAGEQTVTLTSGSQVKEVTFTAVANEEVEVLVDFIAEKSTVDITIDGTLQPHGGELKNCDVVKHCNTCSSKSGYYFFTAFGLNNGNQVNSLVGVRAECDLLCDIDSVLCFTIPRLKVPLLYKLGIELLKEWQASDRLNWLTLHSDEWVDAKRDEWEQVTYNQYLGQAMAGMARYLQQIDSNCFQCGGFHHAHVHP